MELSWFETHAHQSKCNYHPRGGGIWLAYRQKPIFQSLASVFRSVKLRETRKTQMAGYGNCIAPPGFGPCSAHIQNHSTLWCNLHQVRFGFPKESYGSWAPRCTGAMDHVFIPWQSCGPLRHVYNSVPNLPIDISSAATAPIVASAILGIAVVTAPSALVALVHMACDPLLGDDVGTVRPYDVKG